MARVNMEQQFDKGFFDLKKKYERFSLRVKVAIFSKKKTENNIKEFLKYAKSCFLRNNKVNTFF